MSPPRRRFAGVALITPPVETVAEPLDALDADFAIHCPRALLDRLIAHAVRYRDREVFGILLGRPISTDRKRMRTVIVDYVAAETFTESRRAYVEVSSSELVRMHEVSEARRAAEGLRTVGWFHTHPGHGIFMSATDEANHRLYVYPWQVALVIDPSTRQWGFFATDRCDAVPAHHVLLDVPAPPLPATDAGAPPLLAKASSDPAPLDLTPAPPDQDASFTGLAAASRAVSAYGASAETRTWGDVEAQSGIEAEPGTESDAGIAGDSSAETQSAAPDRVLPAGPEDAPAPGTSARKGLFRMKSASGWMRKWLPKRPARPSAPRAVSATRRWPSPMWWVVALGTLSLVAAITLLHVRFSIQEARLEEGNVRIRDLQLRFEDFLKRGSPR